MTKFDVRRILCPTDFSVFSRRAFEYALAIAAWYEAALTAVHVIADAIPPANELAYLANPMLLDPAQEAASCELSALLAPARKLGLRAGTAMRKGNPAAEIVTMAGELPADLVVMGTHGRTGFQRYVLGSVAETVLRRAQCPVLTVPGRAPEHPGPLFFKTIVCATDLSAACGGALAYAAALAGEAGARLIVAHVLDPEKLRGFDERCAGDGCKVGFETPARFKIQAALRRLRSDVFSTEDVVTWGAPAPEILKLAHAQNAGLIVAGVHGRSLLDLMAFGSVTHELVREATCPVLTVRMPSA